ncbi:MAG: hypothetical protein R3E79_07625 [Caldilineaceae bacterium]
MRPWRWIINKTYKQIVAQSLRDGPDLFNALDRVEQTFNGYPQEGQYVIEDRDGNIVRWQVAGYELLYERKVDTMHLLMASIQRQ